MINVKLTTNPDFTDNIVVLRNAEPENGILSYSIIDKGTDYLFAERYIDVRDGSSDKEISDIIDKDFCKWKNAEGGMEMLNEYYLGS